MTQSTFKLQELCELSYHQASDGRLSLNLKERILGYNNNENYTTKMASAERTKWLAEMKHEKNKQMLTEEQEEYLDELLHPELVYTRPKKPHYQITRTRYGQDNYMFESYQDSFSSNIRNNVVNFRLLEESETKLVQQLKQTTNFVREFFDRFGHVLQKESPEFWQLNLFDILKLVSNQKKTDQDLRQELPINLPDEQGIKYLITFRKEICGFLEATNYFKQTQNQDGKDVLNSIGVDNSNVMAVSRRKNKEKPTEHLSRFLLTEELSEVDFLKMKDNELALKIPTLRRRDDDPEYIYFRIEPLPKVDHKVQLVNVSQAIPPQYRPCFESDKLNVIQSTVFQHAYNANENMLVCAPTGAGKTNIATLTILNVIKRFKDGFKVIYISPMKALANELVQKFTKKFSEFKTREMTGDIQLSQKELATTHIIVTTPEKLDVVTRKNSALMEEVKLVIFDEVHLLNDERGWVLESLVARLFRSVYRTQKTIRIVGLSATLPNYGDVAMFLKVGEGGLFHFDSTFRPVPLMIHFYGIKSAADQTGINGRRRRQLDVLNEKCYEYCMKHVKAKKQVLVFCHSRKETMVYCKYIMNRALELGDDVYLGQSDKLLIKYRVTDRELQKVAPSGLAFHHAGMVRADRNQVERMFMNGDVKILVATATLAWGVNLPAYAVVIKGTDVYDVNLSESKDLSILDVQQMFGRAGRPQFDTNGEAALMTDFKKVNKYMGALTSTVPIESKFPDFLKEAMNAEICSGTVTNVMQAFEWLKYTFFAIRAFKNPRAYGCPSDDNEVQMQLHFDEFMRGKVLQVVRDLDRAKLIRFDHLNETVASTELGRITSHFYIKCETMENFCTALHLTISHENPSSIQKKYDYKSDLQLLNILAHSKQFENIRVRLEEFEELKTLVSYWILEEQPDFGLPNRGGMPKNFGNYQEEIIIETPQKVLLLLQGYLRDLRYENYSLTNDTQYIVQQSVRLLRCLFDLCCKKNQAMNVQVILKWCKFIENRMYLDNGPLRQFLKISYSGYNSMRVKKDGFMPKDFYDRMQEANLGVNQAIELGPEDLAAKLGARNKHDIGHNVMKWCRMLPKVSVAYKIKPIAQTILKVDVEVLPKWYHDAKWHLKSEVFWVFFDDEEEILHSESFLIDEGFVRSRTPVQLSFFIPYRDSTKKKYRLLIRSDRWIMDDENEFTVIDLNELGIVMDTLPFTPLLNIEPLPKTALKNELFESLYTKFNFFNPIQSQLFFPLYHTDNNILIGAPTGSGKTIMSELALLRLFAHTPQKKCVYVAPLKSLAKERLIDWVPRLEALKKSVVELTGDYTPDLETLTKAHVIITTPEKWDGITRNKERKYAQNIGLIIFDEIHLLGQDRGAVIEVIVSRMNKESKVRMIGLSTAMANGNDVAEWFGTGQYGFFNFKASVRPVPIEIHFEGFSEKNYCPRMQTMNKPAYNAIKKFSEGKPVLLFVSSRRQTRLTALDLIALSEHQTRGGSPFIKCNHEELHSRIEDVSDEYLKQTLNFGIGMHHAGLNSSDRKICEDLFVNGKIQVLIATSTLAWGVNFPARLVIIKGTQFFDPKTHRYVDFPATDLLQMIGRAGRPQFDSKGVAVVYCEQSKKMFYRRYLNDPFPIESSLVEQLDDHINAEIARGTISTRQGCIDWFTYSYAFRRILKNPNFYSIEDNKNETIKKFLIELVDKSVKNLTDSKCIEALDDDSGTLMPAELGFIASSYYLKHQTVKYFYDNLNAGMTFEQVLWVICHAEEFKETPLRHNEDNFNKELSDIAPYRIKDYSSPQAKTYLLFQMHLFDLPPPIRDYVTDGKLILDASTRVVLGALEVAKEKKLLDIVLTLVYIEQLIFQGLQCNIPYASQELWKKIQTTKQKGFPGGLAQIVEEWSDPTARQQFFSFFKQPKNQNQFTRDKQREIDDVISSIPKIRIGTKLIAYDSEEMKADESKPIYEDMDECVVRVSIHKENKCSNKLVLQKGTKVKEVSWWVIVGDHQNNLLGLKRAILKTHRDVDIRVGLPQDFSTNPNLKIFVMSDSYCGLDQEIAHDLKQYIKK